MRERPTFLRRAIAAIVVAATVSGLLLVGPSGPVGAVTISFPNTPIASDRVNGVGWATLIVGDTIYLGGEFTQVRGDNGAVIANRANVVAFDADTGRMRTAFNASTNGRVNALASDGSKLFVGGTFTTVNGLSRGRVAAVDLVSGAVRTDWVANASSIVYSLSVGGNRLYIGGTYSTIKNVPRTRVASVSLTNGDVDPAFNPGSDGTVRALRATTDGGRVVLGGSFTQVAGTARPYLVSVDGRTGAITGTTYPIIDPVEALDIDNTNTRVAVAVSGTTNQGVFYDLVSGTRLVRQRCGGDAQAITMVEDSMITGFHEECDGDFTIRLASNNVRNGQREHGLHPGVRPLLGRARARRQLCARWPSPVTSRMWGVGRCRAWPSSSRRGAAASAAGDREVDGLAAGGISTTVPIREPRGGRRASTTRRGRRGTPSSATATATRRRWSGSARTPATSTSPPTSDRPSTSARCRSPPPSTCVADDGAVVYVNGTEVVRDNLPAGSVTSLTRSATGRSGTDENAARTLRPAGVGTPTGNEHDRGRGPPGRRRQLGPELRPRGVTPVRRGPDDHDDNHHDDDDHDHAAATGPGRFPARIAVALPGERGRPGHHLDRAAVRRRLVERRHGPAGLRRRRRGHHDRVCRGPSPDVLLPPDRQRRRRPVVGHPPAPRRRRGSGPRQRSRGRSRQHAGGPGRTSRRSPLPTGPACRRTPCGRSPFRPAPSSSVPTPSRSRCTRTH